MASSWMKDHMPGFLLPAMLLTLSLYHLFMTILEVSFVQLQPWKLLNVTDLRFKGFARLWSHCGEELSTEMPGPITKLLSTCSGLVLDIGPGSGEQLRHFTPSRITAAYGAEPAADLHPKLISTAEKVGFAGGKYHALLCGAEPESLIPALHKNGLLATAKSGTGGGAAGNSAAGSEVFDEICSVRVLCGVPRPRETVKGLYELLKPGGRLVVCEHVVNQRSAFARGMQMLYMLLGWSFFMGGCELQRDTERFLREAGEWERVEIEQVGSMDTIPYIVGELFKKER